MTDQRKGEIAYLYLKNKLREEGFYLGPDMQEQITETAKQIQISATEAKEFVEKLVREIVDESFEKMKTNE